MASLTSASPPSPLHFRLSATRSVRILPIRAPAARIRSSTISAPRHSFNRFNRAGQSSSDIVVACSSSPSATSAPAVHSVRQFLEDLKAVGRVRIIVNTGVGVLESVTTLEKLFYSDFPGKGEYANLMNKEDNVDFHLLVDKVASAKLIQGKSMKGDIPTYMVRFFDQAGSNAASLLVMWRPDTNGVYDDGQVDAFSHLITKYGAEVSFAAPN